MPQKNLKVEDFILQRDRMKLIDRIISIDEKTAISESKVTPKWPLFENGYIHPIIIIELVAQTAGIFIKWEELNKNSSKDGKGVLAGIKKAIFYVNNISVDSVIRAYATREYNLMNYAEFSGTAKMGEKKLGDVVLQLFRTD